MPYPSCGRAIVHAAVATARRSELPVTCAILHHLLKCFLSWTQIAHLGSDLHCSKTQAIARKGKVRTCCLNSAYGRTTQATARKGKFPVTWQCTFASIHGFKSVYERTSKTTRKSYLPVKNAYERKTQETGSKLPVNLAVLLNITC